MNGLSVAKSKNTFELFVLMLLVQFRTHIKWYCITYGLRNYHEQFGFVVFFSMVHLYKTESRKD